MRSKTKSKTEIPGIAIVAIIIVFIGLGAKGIKHTLSNNTENQSLETSQKVTSAERVKPENPSSSNWAPPTRTLSDYQVIVEQDLLKPLGWQKTIAMPSPPKPVPQRERRQERPAPTNDLILTGIVHLGEESIALIEDISEGEAYFLREGDKLKGYIVEAITEENIVLVNGNSKLTPALGSKAHYSSNGQIVMSGLTDKQTIGDSAESMDERTASSDVGSANLSLIDRMKARRRKELGTE